MKECRLYQCEICNTQYKDQELAKECENYHKVPEKVQAIKYRSLKSGGEYPDFINVTFDDGSIRKYKYEGRF